MSHSSTPVISLENTVSDVVKQCVSSSTQPRFAVAYSGGVDSTVLLHILQCVTAKLEYPLYAFHVHHGLSPNADSWLQHCAQQAQSLGVTFSSKNITLTNQKGKGVEDAARTSRYQALGSLCSEHQITHLFTAHHQDDQVETLLLHLFRGAGLQGVIGMDVTAHSPLLKNDVVTIVRPLLSVSKEILESAAKDLSIVHIEDESNQDTRYTRNAIRHQIVPVLKEYFPGVENRLLRFSQHAAVAQELLTTLAQEDCQKVVIDDALDIAAFQTLDKNRQYNVLQYWLEQHQCRIASSAWLEEVRQQLMSTRDDAQVCVQAGSFSIQRYAGRAYVVHTPHVAALPEQAAVFQWQGESVIAFPTFGGQLCFNVASYGFNAVWLREQSLLLTGRSGGERLKIHPKRPSKGLKEWYQERRIPGWERALAPLVMADDYLLYAAKLGMNYQHAEQNMIDNGIALVWQTV